MFDNSSNSSKFGLNKLTLRKSAIAAAILLICGVSACGRTASVETLIAEARQYQKKGDDAAAQIQLKNALQKNPDNVEARYLLGVVENETGDPLSAEKELRKALSLGMNAEMVLPDLAQSLLMQGQFQKALDETEKVSTQKEVLALRGNAFLGLGKISEANASFNAALALSPDLPSALIGLARSALLEKNVEAATRFTEQAANKNPGNIKVLLFQASLLREQGATEPALAVLNQVLVLRPDNVDAHINKADLEIRAKKFDAAKVDIDAAQKLAPKNLTVNYMQAVLDFSQGKNTEALAEIQKVLNISPDYMPGLLIAGALQYSLGSMHEAQVSLTKYLEKNPDNLYARKLLASSLLKDGKIPEASALLAPALKASPKDIELLALAGEISMQSRDFTKASQYFGQASTLAPKTAKFHTALGLSNLGLGQNASAITELETATTLDAKSPQAAILLIMTHLRLGEFDQALKAANALEKEQPDNPLVQNLKGGIYVGKKDAVSARASFQKALSIQATYFPAIANLAELDLKDKNPDAAIKRFDALLVADKKNIDAMNALAKIAMSQKHVNEATKWLERASNDNPESLPAALQLTSHYLQIGEKQKALTLARKLQASNPTDPSTVDLLAQAQFATDDKTAALKNYERLAVLLPESAPLQMKIAAVQIAMGNKPATSEAVKKALLLQPDYLDAQVLQASLYMRDGNAVQAIAMAKRIQKQPGQAARGYELEGDILMSQKQFDPAANAYGQAFATNKQNPTTLMKLLGSLKLAGKGKAAEVLINQWFKDHPKDSALHMYLAGTYLTLKQNKAAIEQYQLVLLQEPENIPALNNLAWSYQQEQDPRALETAEKAYRLAPESPPIADTLGWLLVQRGDTKRGIDILQKASIASSGAPDIRYHLVLALQKAGDKTKAQSELQQLLASGKPFAQIDEAKSLLNTM